MHVGFHEGEKILVSLTFGNGRYQIRAVVDMMHYLVQQCRLSTLDDLPASLFLRSILQLVREVSILVSHLHDRNYITRLHTIAIKYKA